MHNELKVFSIVLIVFVFIAEFQDKLVSEHLRVMKFHEICMLRNYIGFWNEVIYALSLTSLLIENKGALVGKCGVQRSDYFLYIIITRGLRSLCSPAMYLAVSPLALRARQALRAGYQ